MVDTKITVSCLAMRSHCLVGLRRPDLASLRKVEENPITKCLHIILFEFWTET